MRIFLFAFFITISYCCTAQWVAKAPMPTPRSGLTAASVNGKIYVMGGFGGLTINEEYDPSTDTWTTKAPVPTARGYAGAVALNGLIYLIGGSSNTGSAAGLSGANEVYDPSTNTWTTKAPMITPRYALSVVVSNGKIYAISGSNGSGSTPLNEEYDPVTDTWTTKASIPTGGTWYNGIASANNMVYLISGGAAVGFNALNREYNPATDTWATKTPIITSRHSLKAVTVGSKIYAVGGYASGSYLTTNELYDPVADTWTTDVPMITARAYYTLTEANGCIYAMGGSNGGSPLSNNEQYCFGITVSSSQINASCNGSSDGSATVTPSNGTPPYNYLWLPGGQTTSTATGLSAGTYTCTVTDSIGINNSVIVVITEPPTISSTVTTTGSCTGDSTGTATVNVSGGTPGYTYNWSDSQVNQTSVGLASGTYTVVVNDNNGCSDTTIAVVDSILNPVVSAGFDDTICNGQQIQLDAGGGNIYQWSPSTGLSSTTIETPFADPMSTTTYTVTGTNANGCSDTDEVTIVVNQNAMAEFTASPTEGQIPLTVNFTNSSMNATNYQWLFGDTSDIVTTDNPMHVYTEDGEYEVQLVANNADNCPDTAIYSFINADATSVLWIPNSFTPDDDGKNDLFTIQNYGLAKLEVSIYNRWGELLYEWNSTTGGWDGRSKNVAVEEGVYVYVLKASGIDGIIYNKTGHISLMR